MNDAAKCFQVLGLKPGCSREELDDAWRERSEAWNPAKFASNETQRARAAEKLRDVNSAYDFLVAKEFGTPAIAPNPIGLWIAAAVLLVLLVVIAYMLVWRTSW